MTQTFSLLGFVAKLEAIDHDLKKVEHAIIVRACQMVAAEAKRVIGEGYPEWPALKPETLARKIGSGPLLETGELRGSIEWTAHGNEGQVGSNLDKAVWHELGTTHIPPRPFLMGAAIRMEPLIHALAAKAVMAVMAGRGLHGSEMSELVHLLKHAGHAVKDSFERFTEGPEDGRRR